MKLFEGDVAKVVYFSNVRIERLFEKPPVLEKFVSDIMIQLRQSDKPDEKCYYPLQLQLKPHSLYNASFRGGHNTMINTQIMEVRDTDGYLFAFSCVEDGNRKLEFVWILRNQHAPKKSLSHIQEMFGRWFQETSTKVTDLIDSHPQLPFCGEGGLLTVVYWATGGVIGILAVAALVVFWKKQCRSATMKNARDIAANGEQDLKKGSMVESVSVGVA